MRMTVTAALWLATCAGVLGACCPVASATGARSLTLADLSYVRLESAAISPDGRQIALVTTRANYADNRWDERLLLIDVATGAEQVLASGRSGFGDVQWSPQGDRLSWLGDGEGNGPPQLFVLSLRKAGASAVRITSTSSGIETDSHGTEPYAWSPDGQFIAYVSADPKKERTGEDRYNRSFEVVDNDYLATEATPTFHLWLVPAAGGTARQLTFGPASIAGLGWRGDSVLVISQPRPHNSPLTSLEPFDFAEFMDASSYSTSLEAIDSTSGRQHTVVPSPGRVWWTPKVSPAGNLIAYATFRGPEPWAHPHDLAVVGPTGGEAKVITTRLDRDVDEYEWIPGAKQLLVTAADGPRWGLWQLSVDGSFKHLDLGPVMELESLSVARKSGVIAFIGSTSRSPGEVYVMDSVNAKPRRLTHLNGSIEELNLGRAQTVTWQVDGFNETGILLYPPNFKKGEKYPLVLNIHGGPELTSTQGFNLLNQVFAAHGWVVFSPNYRGSNSQGDAFQSAVSGDLGEGPGRDVMAGVAAVKKLGFVDEKRVAVSGWSYGGYMTVWLIGHYQGWSSAVAGAPLVNLLDWYDLSGGSAWAKAVLKGSPWVNHNFMHYWRESPVFYADKVKTPILILQNMGDPQVPYTGSYGLYHALRDNGVQVKFIVYPLPGHSPSGEPVQERDAYGRWVNWIGGHFAKR